MNNYFVKITKRLYLKPSIDSNTNDIDEITKHFVDHISVCKIEEAYSEIIREDNFVFKMVYMDEVEKVVSSKLKNIFYVWCHPCKYPQTNCRGSFEISGKHCQSFSERIHFSRQIKQSEVIRVYKKLDPFQKANYGPVSLWLHISKAHPCKYPQTNCRG